MIAYTRAQRQGAIPGIGRKAVKQLNERLRREQRELVRELQERMGRGCYPVRDEAGLPRID